MQIGRQRIERRKERKKEDRQIPGTGVWSCQEGFSEGLTLD